MNESLDKDQKFIRKLTEITLANLRNENFGVSELARESGVSKYILNRRLYSITGKTINQFIRKIRLKKALEMLQNEELTASEVTYKVGFSNPAYFNKCFHEFFGYPPGKVSKGSFEIKEEAEPLQLTVQQGKKRTARLTFILVSSLFLAVSVILIYNYFKRIPEKCHEKSIAVLPFKNLSDTLANQYFIDGLMEEILSNLSKIHDLRVVSRTSVEQFRGSSKSASEIGKKLKVDYIVEGSGQKYGNTFALRVQLIKASGDRHIWAETYEQEIRETKDIFKIQSRVAQSIAAKLKATITPDEKQLIEETSTTNLTAYDFYLRGREEEEKYSLDNKIYFATKLNTYKNTLFLRKAEDMYHKALKYDSAFALAYTGLARVYRDKYSFKSKTYFNENYLDSVLILCNIALSYDDHLADAHTIKGKYYQDINKPEQALKEFEKAISLNPNDWASYWEKGNLYYLEWDCIQSLNYFEKAISLYRGEQLPILLRTIGEEFMYIGFPEKAYYCWKEALNLDGDSSSYFIHLWNNEWIHANYEKAVEYGDKVYAIDSTFARLNMDLAISHIFLGNYEKSLKYLNKHLDSLKAHGQIEIIDPCIIGYIYMKNGYKEKAEYYFDETLKNSNRMINLGREYTLLPDVYYDMAAIYAFRGEKDKAFKNLRILSQKYCGDVRFGVLFKNDPLFNSIRDKPEFQDIVRKVEASYQAEHERVRKWLEERGEL